MIMDSCIVLGHVRYTRTHLAFYQQFSFLRGSLFQEYKRKQNNKEKEEKEVNQENV